MRAVIGHMSDSQPRCGEITDEFIASIETPWRLADEFHSSHGLDGRPP
jgi:hypothetical protein